ncbi:hypothetical protein NDU88_006510 [Pleurodeles waltl]|uniref:Uncharacterized protein n=1 Tax=Pleurodeles waltl TaxID=8319 RepID=A0AAV7MD30_PLEWA|nr:hypothetical protein NDU88_006510 [Pleurodeles waltl]
MCEMDTDFAFTVQPPSARREPSFVFARKVQFSANKELSIRRSKAVVQPRPVPDNDIWKRKPPDFSVRLYRSLQLPQLTAEYEREEVDTRNRIRFWETVSELSKLQGELFPDLMGRWEPPKLQTRFPHIGPYEASLMFVKNGKFPSGPYKDPKPHDFRQYETDIPDFDTTYERDPSDLKLKYQALNTVHGLPSFKDKQQGMRCKKITTFKPQELKWDSKLALPNDAYPPKSASFTRHRRRRGAYSALLDRVEEKLTKTWQAMDTS